MALSSKLKQIVDTRLSVVALEVGQAIGQAQIVNLRQRVAQGLGVYDQKMPPYSPGYRRKRAKTGRQVDNRDLTYSGRMLGSLTQELNASETGVTVVIRFADAPSQQKARWNQAISPWFGVSPRDLRTLRAVQADALTRALKRRT